MTRTVIVTGARGGIGEATANKFLSLGDRVYGTDSSFDETSHELIAFHDGLMRRRTGTRLGALNKAQDVLFQQAPGGAGE